MQIRYAWLLIALCLPKSASSQNVRVAVVDRATRTPVAGAITSLVDTNGTRVTVRLTDENGQVTLLGRTGGRGRVVVETIGYVTERTETFELVAGTTERMIAIESRPLMLEKVAVRDRGRCDASSQGASAATLWEEARKALTATRINTQQATSFAVWRYVRRMDLSHRVIAETTNTSGTSGGAFAAAPSRLLNAEGFKQEVGGSDLYFAPDAHLLLDQSFVQAHCFSIREDNGPDRVVGLTFEPQPGRSGPDVEGVLWIERKTGNLRWLDFTYSQQPVGARDNKAGGRIDFERLADGSWVIVRWHIRLPVLARTQATQVGRLSTAAQDTVIGFREEGGWLTTVAADRDSPTAHLTGVVFDSLRSEPIANVRIVLGGFAAEARTDSSGRFSLRHVMPGRYVVRAEHPRLAAYSEVDRDVVLTLGQTTSMNWAVPAATTLRHRLCHSSPEGSTTVLAHVVDSVSGMTIEGARTQVRWRNISLRSVDGTAITAIADSVAWSTTDGHGTATFCIGGRESRITLRSEKDGRAVELSIALPDSAIVSEALLRLPPHEDRRFRLHGRVVGAASSEPVAAEILLPALGRSTHTRADGTFEIDGLAAGAVAVIVRSPAYTPLFTRVVVPVNDSLLRFVVERLPQSLQPITVEGTRDIRSFEERRAVQAGGSYLSRQDLAARETSRLSDILRSVRGVRIQRRPDGSNVLVSPRGYFSRSVRDCYYQIILDGQRLFALRAGGSEGAVPPSIDDFAPAHLEGIEIYTGPATTPPQYSGLGAACGTIILWTRRGPP